jgi:hypothetical protein
MSHPNAQQLHFVTLTGPSSQNALSSDDHLPLRSLVMQGYLRQRNDPKWQFSPASISEDIKTHVSRFRTARKSSNLKPVHRTKRRRKSGSVRNYLTKPRNIASATPTSSLEHIYSSPVSPVHDLDMVDPFQTLAIDLTEPETLNLLQYYHVSFWANSYACNPEGRWLSTALMDPAMLHSTLSLVAIHRRDRFSFDLSKMYFKHRGEAMKIIVHRLSDTDQAISDATIGAVALLSSSDNHFDWSSEVQSQHSTGLARLIAMRGGIKSLRTNRHIQRVAGWADLLHSSLHSTKPSLDLPFSSSLESQLDDESREDIDLETGARLRSIRLQPLPSPVAQIIQALRKLTKSKISLLNDRNETVCQSFSDMLWKLEYGILELQDVLKRRPKTVQSTSLFWSAPMISSVGTAALILSYSSLRDLVAPILFYKLESKLKLHLSKILEPCDKLPNDSRTTKKARRSENFWGDHLNGNELSILLWVLYLGWEGSRYHDKNRTWFATQIARVCWQKRVLSEVMLQEEIQKVVPQQVLSKTKELWTAVKQIVVPDISTSP